MDASGGAAPAAASGVLPFEVIRQHAGPVTAERRVRVKVPGKFFPNLLPSEQSQLSLSVPKICMFMRRNDPVRYRSVGVIPLELTGVLIGGWFYRST